VINVPKAAFTSALQRQDLVITSYALIQGHERTPKRFLARRSWMKPKILKIQRRSSHSQCSCNPHFGLLTGTPVENRLQELWSILDFPGYLGSRQFFQRRFAMPIEKYGDALRCKHCDRSFSPLFCGGSKQTAKSFKTSRKAGNDSILWP